ncbi:RHS repeat-associated core domain-containing protein [Streptomyces sp. NPDC007872]|uniref:RHS repeat-associated core domain-containing protein n=1 Tax=Streptomyces sp. NPDC007872 TaxID=3364782 RepID=UPI00368F5FC0
MGAVVALAITATLLPAGAWAAVSPRGGVTLPDLQSTKPVPGADSEVDYQVPPAPETQGEYAVERTAAPVSGTGTVVINGGTATAGQQQTIQQSVARQALWGGLRAAPAPVTGRPGEMVRVGDLPVMLGAAPGTFGGDTAGAPAGTSAVEPASAKTAGKTAAKTAATPVEDPAPGGTWQVTVADRETTEAAGIDGVLMKLEPAEGTTGPVQVGVNYKAFEQLYGADWGSRLQLIRLPECFLTTPDAEGCADPIETDSVNDAVADTVSTTVDPAAAGEPGVTPSAFRQASFSTAAAGGGGFVLAATGGGASPSGDYSATSLQPSGKWTHGGSSGGFNWSYPLQVPPVIAGPKPEIALSYSSQMVDGRTSTTNNQASWIGDGWDYHPGFIERQFRTCSDDRGKDAQGRLPNTTKKKGDLCWWGKTENAVLSLNGSTAPLVKDDTTGLWKLANDDGTRIEHKTGADNGDKGDPDGKDTGEYWVITTPDGVRYHFGRHKLPGWTDGKPTTESVFTAPVFGNHPDEPCYKAGDFAGSSCTQAYRWNLDYVEDTTLNAMAIYHKKEINHYALNEKVKTPVSYVRGGHPVRIEYGLSNHGGNVYAAPAPARVVFTTPERCMETETFDCDPEKFTKKGQDAQRWPDTPSDTFCASGKKCYVSSPTFWTRVRLSAVTTEVAKTPGGTDYRKVDGWELKQNFLHTRYDTNPPLWLDRIVRTGYSAAGTAKSLPPVVFHANGDPMPNRVSRPTDDRPPFERLRIAAVYTETGGGVKVTYSKPCDPAAAKPKPEANGSRCYPVNWSPSGEDTTKPEWFNKYVVERIQEEDHVGGSPPVVTTYEYVGDAAWAKDDSEFTKAKQRTWNEWRGYAAVRVRTGETSADEGTARTLVEHRYYRGMHGDPLPDGAVRTARVDDHAGAKIDDDLPAYQGQVAETVTYRGDAATPVIDGSVVTKLWTREAGRHARTGASPLISRQTATLSSTTTAHVSGGKTRTTSNTTLEFDPAYPLPVRTQTTGDTEAPGDETCSVITYRHNTSAGLLGYPVQVRTTAGTCATAATAGPDRLMDDTRTFYDDLAFGAAPTKGLVTRVEDVQADGTGHSLSEATAYDKYGRATATTDSDGRVTRSEFTPTDSVPTRVVVTNPKGHKVTTDFETGRGLALTKTDANNRVSRLEHDPLGRLVKVWSPGRSGAGQPHNLEYEYRIDGRAPTVVTARALRDNGTYALTKTLYDGRLRERQSQTEAIGGGRIVTDTLYNSNGGIRRANAKYFALGELSDTPYVPKSDTEIPSWTASVYDGMNRSVRQTTWHGDVQAFTAGTEFGGDYTTTLPPPGGTPVRTWKDTLGRVVRVDHFTDAERKKFTSTSYQYDVRGQRVRTTDADGVQWSSTYDVRGQELTATDPDRGTSSFTYDNSGRQLTVKDSRGVVLETEYDELGRKTAQYRVEGEKRTKRASWLYDSVALGLLTSSTRYEGTAEYVNEVTGYDAEYLPTGRKVVVPEAAGALKGTYTYAYTYTPTGKPATTTLPAGGGLTAEQVVNRYTPEGLALTTSGTDWYVNDTRYDPQGRVLQTTAGNAPYRMWTTNFYDPHTGRLTQQVNDREVADHRVNDVRYAYDTIGNVKKATESTGSGTNKVTDTQCYVYDTLRQLTEAWTSKTPDTCAAAPAADQIGGPQPYWHSYTFGPTGSRLTEKKHDPAGDTAKDVARRYGYPAPTALRPHTLTSVTTQVGTAAPTTADYVYDAAGNTEERTEGSVRQKLDWDAEGRLQRVGDKTTGGELASYVYDADGNRLIGKTPTGSTLYLGETEITALPNGTLTGTRYYTHVGAPTFVRVATTAGGADKVSALITDYHNTAGFAVALAPGMSITQRKLTAYGQARGTAPATWPGKRGFVGGTLDETGLTHLGAREYDPALGRFLSVDPIIDMLDPLQMQGYNYGYNNPLAFTDPDGLWGWSDVTHATLDVVGMVPVVGEAADLVNAGIYAAEGDWENAALSAASAVPVAGNVATGAKWAKNASKAIDATTAAGKKADAPNLSKQAPPTKEAPAKKQENNNRKKDKDDDEEYVDLYHGTTLAAAKSIQANGVDPDFKPRNMDFGTGFYTTNLEDQAKEWAERQARSAAKKGVRGDGAQPAVIHFRIPKSEFAKFKGKVFTEANDEWAKEVAKFRADSNPPKLRQSRPYVEGPMLMNSRSYPKTRGVKPVSGGHQISFHVVKKFSASFWGRWFARWFMGISTWKLW